MKKILLAVLAAVVVLVALVLAHPFWLGPVVRTAVSALAPKFLGVPVRLDGFSLNAYTGRLVVEGLAVDNPPACGTEKFVKVGRFCIDVDPLTVLSDTIVLDEISVADLYVGLQTDDRGVYNFQVVANGGEKGEKPAGEKKAEAAPEPAREKKPAPKVIIDLLEIQTALVQWKQVPLPLPSFRMTGIGRPTGGIEFEKAWEEIKTKFVESLGPLAKGLQDSLALAQQSLGAGVKVVGETAKQLNDVTAQQLKGATEKLGDVAKPVGDVSAKTVETASKALDGATKSVGDVSAKATETATKATETATKALKSLFK